MGFSAIPKQIKNNPISPTPKGVRQSQGTIAMGPLRNQQFYVYRSIARRTSALVHGYQGILDRQQINLV